MINWLVNSRFNLGLRPATASSNSLFNREADGIDGNASAFPDSFTLETLLVPADASHPSLFARFLDQQRRIRALVFNPLRILFHSLQTSDTPSRFFSITSTLFARVPGAARSPSKYAHQSAPAHPATRSRTERHNARLYFVTSLLPYSPPRNLIRRLIILWRRDTEPTLLAWVYTPVSGFVFDALA
jgi:hypothetical protein